MTVSKIDANIEKSPGLHKKLFDTKKSNLQKYQDYCIGSYSILKLLKYELITSLFGGMPGAFGIILRNRFYRVLLKKVGKNVNFGRNITIRHPHKIEIGNNVIIDDNCLIDAKGDDNFGIVIGDNVTIGRNCSLNCKNGNIIVESHVNITTNVNLVVASGGTIQIGNNIDIGSFTHFSAGTYDISRSDMLPSAQGKVSKGIVIEDLVWIGAGVVVLDGVRIGESAIIGAGAVVNNDIPPKCVALGVPAKIVKERA